MGGGGIKRNKAKITTHVHGHFHFHPHTNQTAPAKTLNTPLVSPLSNFHFASVSFPLVLTVSAPSNSFNLLNNFSSLLSANKKSRSPPTELSSAVSGPIQDARDRRGGGLRRRRWSGRRCSAGRGSYSFRGWCGGRSAHQGCIEGGKYVSPLRKQTGEGE